MDKIREFILQHKELAILVGLLVACYFFFFYQMGAYPLIDVDETRYVAIARDMFLRHDFLTLKLNSEFFFEKPPLYFWFEILSFKLFGKVNEFSARVPIACVATFFCFFMFFVGKKINSAKFAVVSTLIMISGMEFLLLSRLAMLDLILSVCIGASIYSGLMTLFTHSGNKKLLWYMFYVFSALAVLAKGLPGLILPLVVVYGAYFFMGRLKEVFAPRFFVVGWVLFFVISLPWHIAMMKLHGSLFFNEYVIKHHFARFFAQHELGRKEPFYFFIPVLLVGILPWTFSFIAMLIEYFVKNTKKIVEYIKSFKVAQFFQDLNSADPTKKFLILNVWTFVVIFLFFSSATTKLPTYILPAVFPLGFLLGHYWCSYIYNDEHKKPMAAAVTVFSVIMIIAGIAALIVPFFLKPEILASIAVLKPFVATLCLGFGIISLVALKTNKKKILFLAYVVFMMNLVMLMVNYIFPVVVNFGQGDLIKYSLKARSEGKPLATFGFGKRYSVLYYYAENTPMQTESDYKWLKEFTEKNKDAYVIARKKHFDELLGHASFAVIEKGNKYMLLKYVHVDKTED